MSGGQAGAGRGRPGGGQFGPTQSGRERPGIARTDRPVDDLLIRGGSVVSVLTGETFEADVAVRGDRISAVVAPGTPREARERIDARGQLVVPGFIDSHMHVESSFLTPAGFAALTLPRGTTTVLADPHEIVNVCGADGLRWMLDEGRRTPQTMLFGVPSCVPALPGFEVAGAELGQSDVEALLDLPGVVGLGEVMDYRAVVSGDARMAGVVGAARDRGAIVDGHCPGLTGAELSEYLALGIDSDHTKNPVPVVVEKARLGMHVQLQEKSLSAELFAALGALPMRPPISLVTDDIAPDAILARGHLDHIARRAVELGMPPLEALRAITLTPAGRLRLHDRGSVTPGRRADLVLLRDLPAFAVETVVTGGRVVARDGGLVEGVPGIADAVSRPATASDASDGGTPFGDTVRIAPPDAATFRWRTTAPDGPRRELAIRVNAVDTSTRFDSVEVEVRDGVVRLPPDTALLTVIHRHGVAPGQAFAPVVGLDLGDGAVATTYAHDSHNLLVLGTSAESMAAAASAVVRARGGIAVARGGTVVALLPLPVAGLMSEAPAEQVAADAGAVRAALDEWGYRHANAFMSVSTLALPVSPSLKLTDRGLVDVERRAWAVAGEGA